MIEIRPSEARDYPAIADIFNLFQPEFPVTVEEIAHSDRTRDPKIRFGRWVAAVNGRVVGYSSHTQHLDLYHPRKFWVQVRVLPEFQRRGLGGALYDVLLQGVLRHDPISMQVSIPEDKTEGLRFAEKRGFVEYSRRWSSLLDLSTFDPAPYAELQAKMAAEGIEMKSFAELAVDPRRDEKYYELHTAVDLDVPLPDLLTLLSFEEFKREFLENPAFLPQGTSVAVHNGEYVGLNSLVGAGEGTWVDLTGVHRDHRRKGIALALKVHGILWARQQGYKTMGVTNDLVNEGILAINERLGFVRQPAVLQLRKMFEAE
ncbi:MAG: GNAT family N-acetyltransferase [bacterium]|nr:GNAT family N-acetyltransferase [bacterium]